MNRLFLSTLLLAAFVVVPPGTLPASAGAGEAAPTTSVAEAVDALAVLLGETDVADAVLPSAIQSTERSGLFKLLVEGQPFGEVLGVYIDEAVSSLPIAHLAVILPAAHSSDEGLLLGKVAQFDFRHPGGLLQFSGEVVASGLAGREGSQRIIRLSMAPRAHELMRDRRSSGYQNVKYQDVIEATVGRHGLTAQLAANPAISRHTVLQCSETDFDFVGRLLEDLGHYYVVDGPGGSTLRSVADSREAPLVPGAYHYRGHRAPPPSLGAPYVHTFQSARHLVPATVRVSAWNYRKKELYAKSETTGIGEGLEDEFIGEREAAQQEVDLEAELRRDRALMAAHAVAGTSTVPTIRPGYRVSVDGVGNTLDGKFFVSQVRHTALRLGSGPSATVHYGNSFLAVPADIRFRPEPRTPRPQIHGLQTAIVTNNLDPVHLARVKVRFPWLDDRESGWARVAAPGAGKERGVLWLPEVGDEVVVAFVHGDPHDPIVLGGLWNGIDKPPLETTAENNHRILWSRSGHRLVLDDDLADGSIALVSRKGSQVAVEDTGNSRKISLEAPRTEVSDVLASAKNAGPVLPVLPGERHRDNAIVAWARVAAGGGISGTASLGVASASRPATGVYRIVLRGGAATAAELVPVAVAEVSRPPADPRDLRLVSVRRIGPKAFEVYVNDGHSAPADSDFVFMVTAR